MKSLFFVILFFLPMQALAASYLYPKPASPNTECLPNTTVKETISDSLNHSRDSYGGKRTGRLYQIDLNGDGVCEYFVKGRTEDEAGESRVFHDSDGGIIGEIAGNQDGFSYGEVKNGYVRILAQAWRGGRFTPILTTNVYSFDHGRYFCEYCTDNSHGGYLDLARKAYDQRDYPQAEIYYWNAYRMFFSRKLSDASNLAATYSRQNKLTEAISLLNEHLAKDDDAIILGEATPCYAGNCAPGETQLNRIKSSAFFNRALAKEKLGLYKDALEDYRNARNLKPTKASSVAIGRVNALVAKKNDLRTAKIVREVNPPAEKSEAKGDIAVSGRLYFDGKPLSDFTKAEAKLRIYIRSLKEWVTPAYEYDPETASFTLHVMGEGGYTCNATVDANPDNPKEYPGDFKGHASFNALLTPESKPLKIDTEKVIHLVEPQDNGIPMQGWGEACFGEINLRPPVRFSWEPIGQGAEYTYKIQRITCSPFAYKEMISIDKTKATSVTLDLPPNNLGEIYRFQITAKKNGTDVGSLVIHGENGYGWDYRFRVVN